MNHCQGFARDVERLLSAFLDPTEPMLTSPLMARALREKGVTDLFLQVRDCARDLLRTDAPPVVMAPSNGIEVRGGADVKARLEEALQQTLQQAKVGLIPVSPAPRRKGIFDVPWAETLAAAIADEECQTTGCIAIVRLVDDVTYRYLPGGRCIGSEERVVARYLKSGFAADGWIRREEEEAAAL